MNGDPWDNRISNLKPKSRANNARNRKYKNKSHETMGVVREVYKTGQEYFSAVWTDLSGKARRKKFPIAALGENEAYKLAKEYRIKNDSRFKHARCRVHRSSYSPVNRIAPQGAFLMCDSLRDCRLRIIATSTAQSKVV
jgi:hypothetical protein